MTAPLPTTAAERRREKTGLQAARALDRAAGKLEAFALACWDCGELSTKQISGRPDQRETLPHDMRELADHLYRRYDRG